MNQEYYEFLETEVFETRICSREMVASFTRCLFHDK